MSKVIPLRKPQPVSLVDCDFYGVVSEPLDAIYWPPDISANRIFRGGRQVGYVDSTGRTHMFPSTDGSAA